MKDDEGDDLAEFGIAGAARGTSDASAPAPDAHTGDDGWVVNLGPVIVPADSTVTVCQQPGRLFRGYKLINTGDEDDLFIQGLFVGQKSQLPTFQNPIAVKNFASNALDRGTLLDICDPALFITIQVHNTSSTPKKFSMSIVGDAVL